MTRVNVKQQRHYFLMWISDLLAPRSCAFCGTSCEGKERSICVGCFADLPWSEPAISPTPGIFECSIAMLHYAFPIDAAIKALKFNRKIFYSPAFGEILCAAEPLLPMDIDTLLPVPLHWRRKMMRGFNQADEIAGPLAKELCVPLLQGVRRIRATPFQSGLNASQRARNLSSAFVVMTNLSEQHVLIVDDVITTGTTVQALAEALMVAGANRVSALAVARAG
jgi:ComF family protein